MKKRIVVIGGGITGLSAAHRLTELSNEKNLDLDVALLEKTGVLGGVISTIERDGFLIEEGPDSFITTKPWALNLSNRLGLAGEIIETNDEKRRTFVLLDGKLAPLPEGFIMLAPTRIYPFLTTPLFSWKGKARMLMDLFIARRQQSDESLASFVRRRLGREALERVAQPMISGVYTADPEKLSLRATMPQFLEMEERYGSVIKGMYHSYKKRGEGVKRESGARYSLFLSYREGMRTLVDALGKSLPDGSVRLNQTVNSLRPVEGGWEVSTEETVYQASGVVLATPSFAAARLLKAFDEPCASLLSDIEYASSAVVILAYKKEDLSNYAHGFGFVVPTIERSGLIACSFSSEKFSGRAPEGYIVLRAFVGGAINPEKLLLSDSEMIDMVERELGVILGINSRPLFTIVRRYPDAMPQYLVGHLELLDRIKEELAKHRGLEIAGNAYEGIGIPDCVNSGERAAERVLETIQRDSGL
ncbi:MAG: protoporphyrinogen oxidase [Deltaproteobacteria bacterium]